MGLRRQTSVHIENALVLLLVMSIVLASCSLPDANASPGIIFSDPSDGAVNDSGYGFGTGQSIGVGDGAGDFFMRGFVKFSLAGISGTLVSATLKMYVRSSHKDGTGYGPGYAITSPLANPGLGDLSVIHIDDYGIIEGLTPPQGLVVFNSPSIGNDPGVLIPGAGAGSTPDVGYISIDVKAAMQDDISHGRSFTTFMLKLATGTDNDHEQDTWELRASEAGGEGPYIEYSLPTPVGGVAIPVNKLAILAPYLALVGLVGAVTVAVATTRRRKP